jgi:hypothetical protein
LILNSTFSTFKKSGAKHPTFSTFSTFKKSGAKHPTFSTFSTFKKSGAKHPTFSTFKKSGAKHPTFRKIIIYILAPPFLKSGYFGSTFSKGGKGGFF